MLALVLTSGCATPIVSAAELRAPRQDQKPTPPEPKSGTAGFQAPAPDTGKEGKFDWIRLTSGEWLKGELDVLRRGKVEFDSDKLDDLKIDWDDVAEVRTAKNQMVLIEGPDGTETHVGKVVVKDGVVQVDGQTVQRFDRKKLLALVPGVPTERNYWRGKINFGLTTRSGNSSQTDFSSYVFARRQTSNTRWETTYNGAFSSVDGVETANNNRLGSKFDAFLTRKLYVTPLGVDLYQDRFQNIRLRSKPYAGFGYDLVDRHGMTWSISLFAGYERTDYVTVPPGEPDTVSSAALVFATNYEWDATSTVELKFDYNITVPTRDTHSYNHHLATIVSVDVIGDLDLDVTFVWDRVNNPVFNGTTQPKQDDFRTTVGLAYSF